MAGRTHQTGHLANKRSVMSYTYDYPRPAVTVDTVVLDLFDRDGIPRVLLIKRKNQPFQGMWAIPGGFLDIDEELSYSAAREVLEETGVDILPEKLQQINVCGELNRDPRGRVISIVFMGIIHRDSYTIQAGDDAEDVDWFRITALPNLAADHRSTITHALSTISRKRP
jgi:8-oxo-dGTP diphosphatase